MTDEEKAMIVLGIIPNHSILKPPATHGTYFYFDGAWHDSMPPSEAWDIESEGADYLTETFFEQFKKEV